MVSEKISKLCVKVERLAQELDHITQSGHARTAFSVVAIMKLSVMTSELMYEDLMERIQQAITSKSETISRP
jgi:tRNA nucleotidyltransferase/poly(A) polymerase